MIYYYLQQSRIALTLGLFLLLLGVPSVSQAEYKLEEISLDPARQDFVVGPGKEEVELAPGETKTINIMVSNRTGVDRDFKAEIEDFSGSDNPSEAVVLLGNDRGPYSLKDYLKIPEMNFLLPNARRAVVPVTISIPADAEPGGLYGSVVFSIVSSDAETRGQASSAPIVSRIGSLIFVRVKGDVEQSGAIKDFSTQGGQWLFTESMIPMRVNFDNTGRIHLSPYGVISVSNMFGQEVERIDMDPWFVMPGVSRLRDVTMERQIMFGRYTAQLTLNPGYEGGAQETRMISFWVLPWKPVVMTIIAGIVVLGLLRFVAGKFELKRKE